MSKNSKLAQARSRRKMRVRRSLRGGCRHRLTVHTTGKHVYAQLIDDVLGTTVAFANSCEVAPGQEPRLGATVQAATETGKRIAERALTAGIKSMLFDRGGKLYHGRVAAVAQAARESGLVF